MNSFNHYAYGSVVSWFYDTIAGLQPLPEAPGWKRFRIAPLPGRRTHARRAPVQTPHGEASSAWRIEDGRLPLVVGIPPNTRADVVLPARDAAAVLLDGAPLARHALAEVTGGRRPSRRGAAQRSLRVPAPGRGTTGPASWSIGSPKGSIAGALTTRRVRRPAGRPASLIAARRRRPGRRPRRRIRATVFWSNARAWPP